ncbi:Endopolyphosphatase [Mortierella alpina]|uniref:Endopolyphosphatase n=1 Tax=Mortierella alpina TaxID=64518 RepID=A0A9P6J4R5_MORAP|nr:Endopolyphosphatase [Mortierella alpina]
MQSGSEDGSAYPKRFLDNEEDMVGGYYGAPHSICDSPFTLVNATFDWFDKNLVGSVDFVVWTGDNARHDSDNSRPRTQEQIYKMNKAITQKFLTTFPPDSTGERLPIVPAIGNNDIYPHNIIQPGPNSILKHYAEIWSDFIPESELHTFRRGGYYASEVVPNKISVLSLNTLYFYIHNTAVDGCKKRDEAGTEHMEWLETELGSLRKRKMVAYLAGHVPPDRKSYTPTCYARYTRLSLEYADVIVGHLYGHANIDHFFLLSDRKVKPSLWAEEDEVYEEEEDAVALSAVDEEDYDRFHALGLTSYLEDLWTQYEDIPKKLKLSSYAVVLVSASVVPTYQPTFRVFTYQLAKSSDVGGGTAATNSHRPASLLLATVDMSEDDVEDGRIRQQELEEYFTAVLNGDIKPEDSFERRKQHHGKHKPRHRHRHRKPRPHPPAVPSGAFGFPLAYTQYWANLTRANMEPTRPCEYEVEYRTREDYGLEDLGVASWLDLAKRIVGNNSLKMEYLQRMVVQTGTDKLLG